MFSYHVDHDLSLRCHFGILKRTFSLVVGSKYDITICDVILVVNKLACKSLYSLSQYTYMITPDCDLYYKRGVFTSSQIYHTKISEEQYSSIFSDEEMKRLQSVCANDSIIYNRCNGVDDSPYAIITICINGFQIKYIGQCTFPSGFDNLFTFLHDNEPKFSRFTGKITRKSSKRWTQVAAMPE